MSPVQTDISDIVAKYWVISLGKHSFCMIVDHLLKLQLAAGCSPKRELTQSLNSAQTATFHCLSSSTNWTFDVVG